MLSIRNTLAKTTRFLVHGIYIPLGLPGSASGKELACQCRKHKRWSFDPWVRKIPWRTVWQPTPGESHGQRSLAGYGPRDHKEVDTTK